MLSMPSTPRIRMGRSVLSGAANWAFPLIPFTQYIHRPTVMFSIEKVSEDLQKLQGEDAKTARGLFRAFFRSKEVGIVQDKYRQYLQLYNFNLTKRLTLGHLELLVEKFNDVVEEAGLIEQRLVVVPEKMGRVKRKLIGQTRWKLELRGDMDSRERGVKPMSLERALEVLFATATAPLSVVDIGEYLEAKGILPEDRALSQVEVGKRVGTLYGETIDHCFYLKERKGEMLESGELVLLYEPRFLSSKRDQFVSRASLDRDDIQEICTPSSEKSEYVLAEYLPRMKRSGIIVVALGYKGRERLFFAGDLDELISDDKIRRENIMEDGKIRQVYIVTQAYRQYASRIFEGHLDGLVKGLDGNRETNSERLRRVFEIGYANNRQSVDSFLLKARTVAQHTSDPLGVVAALIADLPLGEVKSKLKKIGFSRAQADRIYNNLKDYHVVRQLPFRIPRDRGIFLVQNFMDNIIDRCGMRYRGQDPTSFLLYLADKLEQSKISSLKKYTGDPDELRFVAAYLAERCGLKSLAGELSNNWFRLAHPKEFISIRQAIREKIGMSREQAGQFMNAVTAQLSHITEHSFVGSIKYEVSCREKTEYAVWEKTELRGGSGKYSLNDTFDLLGIRMIVTDAGHGFGNIYALASEISSSPEVEILKKPDDDLINPRKGGWQAYTIVVGLNDIPVEIQIMTKEMEEMDHSGATARWVKRAQDEVLVKYPNQQFDEDPTGIIIKDDLPSTFGNLWQHLSGQTRVFYLGNNCSTKDYRDFLAGERDYLIHRLNRHSYPADVAADRIVDLFDPNKYNGVVAVTMQIDEKDNSLVYRDRGKLSEDNFLWPSTVVSVLTNGGTYLTPNLLSKIDSLNPSVGHRTRLLSHMHRRGYGEEWILHAGLDGIDDLRDDLGVPLSMVGENAINFMNINQAMRGTSFRNPAELFAAVSIGVFERERAIWLLRLDD